MGVFKEKFISRIEAYKLLESELERYLKIFKEDKATNFENNYFETSIKCHIEDLLNLIDDLKNSE